MIRPVSPSVPGNSKESSSNPTQTWHNSLRIYCIMERYKNLQGNSGVTAYSIDRDSIIVAFQGGHVYMYTKDVTGKEHIQNMQKLARAGRGLATYISRHVKDRYAEQL